ncbi:MAG: phosphoribosylpyrophosphate synthetase [Rickettsiales bacterium]|nr:MAG: phosphoribosylpyrophosphate synthetase [Rickettsiales bacterium]
MKIISGMSNPQLAARIAKEIGAELLDTKTDNFSDGELRVQVHGDMGNDVIIVQSTSTPVNNHLMELLLLADTTKRAGAQNITAIVPYFGYSRQDRCTYKHGPISASLVIKMIESAGVTKLITLDLHSSQLEGMFNIPIINLATESIFFSAIENRENSIVVSPDIGGIARARNYSSLFGVDLAIINKSRNPDNSCSMNGIIGDVSGKNCIIIDDIIDGASTLCLATELLLAAGALSVEAIITHAVLSGDAVSKVENSGIKQIYISDSICHNRLPPKFVTMPIHQLIGVVL